MRATERIEVTKDTRSFRIGYTDENNVTLVAFDISPQIAEFGEGRVELLIEANGSGKIYPVPVEINDTWAEWLVQREQIPLDGGRCQLSYFSAGDAEKKTTIYSMSVKRSIGANAGDVPPESGWVEVVINAAVRAEQAAADASASADEAKEWAKEAQASVGNKRNWATVRLDKVAEITSLESLRTYFYNLRKSESRDYQVEVSPGNNQNFVEALGGLPDGVTPTDKFFLYFTIPYSEAGGFVLDIDLEGRTNGEWFTRKMWGTIDANWRDSGWKNPYGDTTVTREYVDRQDAATLETANTHSDSGDAKTLNSAKQYAEQQDETALAEAKAYADRQDATNLATAKTYAESQDAVTLNTAKSYADEQNAVNLDAAKAYTDSEIASLPSGVTREYVDEADATTLASAKEYADSKLVTIDVEIRSENSLWTKPVTTGQQIIDMVNAGKEVRLHFFDTITNTGDQLYAYETTAAGVPYFRRNVVTADKVERINIGVQYNGEAKFTKIPYVNKTSAADVTATVPVGLPSGTAGNTQAVLDALAAKPSGGTLEKLTFTGASTGEYDGTAPLTVNIPTGGGGGEAVKLSPTFPTDSNYEVVKDQWDGPNFFRLGNLVMCQFSFKSYSPDNFRYHALIEGLPLYVGPDRVLASVFQRGGKGPARIQISGGKLSVAGGESPDQAGNAYSIYDACFCYICKE